jgi:hypothetical protein
MLINLLIFFEKYAEACRRESPAHNIIIIIIIIIGSKTTASMHSKWQNVQSTSFMVLHCPCRDNTIKTKTFVGYSKFHRLEKKLMKIKSARASQRKLS